MRVFSKATQRVNRIIAPVRCQKMIEKNIGISKEFNNFELQKAVVARDVLKANRIIDYFDKNPKDNPIILTISSLFSFFA